MTQPTAAIVVIGNEVLSGRTQDANLAYLGRELSALGIRVAEARVVPDVTEAIVEAVNHLRGRHAHVFTTGGIGPTHDDITTAAVARAFGVGVRRHPEAERRLRDHYGGRELNAARLKMADVPDGAELIDNPMSGAPGYRLENVYVLAGVPRIAQAMFDGLRAGLTGGPPIGSRTVAAEVGEGDLAAGLAAIQAAYPDLDLGSYPYFRAGRLGVSVVARGTDPGRLDAAADAVRGLIRDLGATPMDEG